MESSSFTVNIDKGSDQALAMAYYSIDACIVAFNDWIKEGKERNVSEIVQNIAKMERNLRELE